MKTLNKIVYSVSFLFFTMTIPGCYTVLYMSQSALEKAQETMVDETREDTAETDSLLTEENDADMYNGYSVGGEYVPSPIWIDYYIAPLPWWYPSHTVSGGGVDSYGSDSPKHSKRNYGQRRTAVEESGSGSIGAPTGTTSGSAGSSSGGSSSAGTSATSTATTTTTSSGNNNSGSSQNDAGNNQNTSQQRETTTRHTESNNERRNYGERGSARGGKK